MSFCTKCGAPVSAKFCGKCGAPVDGREPVDGQTHVAIPPVPPVNIPPSPVIPKKRGPWLWIFLGCFGLVAIAGILAVSTGLFVAYKARQAGLDPELMEKNPGLAVAKLMAAANPDIEVLSVDDNRGIIKVREKKTGKTLTMNLEDVKKGKIVFLDDEGQKLEMRAQGEGENASVEIRGADGAMRMGAGAVQLPAWLPGYPGAESTGQFGFSGKEGNAGSYAFKTSDSVEDVASFYEDALRNEGFTVERIDTSASAQGAPLVLSSRHESSNRTAQITIGRSGEATTVSLLFSTKDR